MSTNTSIPRRSLLQISLRTLLLLMAAVGVVLGAWNWQWEEVIPFGADRIWTFGESEGREVALEFRYAPQRFQPSRVTANFRRDWRWRKVPTGLVRGYDAKDRRLFEANYDADGGLANYRVFNEVGHLSDEGGVRGTCWLDRTYTRRGTIKREQSRDRHGVRHGRFVDGTEEQVLLDGYFEQGTRNGPWREVIVEQDLVISEQWKHGKRHGEWLWMSLLDQSSYTTQYLDDHLVSVNGVTAPTQIFLEWLRRNLEGIDSAVLPSPPYDQQTAESAYIVLDLGDDAGMRWFEIQFPCGTIAEVEEIAHREVLIGGGAAAVSYRNRTADALLELAMRCDLVLDASGGRLIITPRSEWCGSRSPVNRGPGNR